MKRDNTDFLIILLNKKRKISVFSKKIKKTPLYKTKKRFFQTNRVLIYKLKEKKKIKLVLEK